LGSFVTAKPAPKDLDILLIMDEDFEVDSVGPDLPLEANCLISGWKRIRLLEAFENADCGTGVRVIQTDDQMLPAQECVANLRRILLEARKVHSRQDHARMAEPILLEVQQREQDILEYLSGDLEQPVASQRLVVVKSEL
jgi:hypothetical protein